MVNPRDIAGEEEEEEINNLYTHLHYILHHTVHA